MHAIEGENLSFSLPIRIFSMRDNDDEKSPTCVVDLIDNAIIAHPNPPMAYFTQAALAAVRSRRDRINRLLYSAP